LELTVHLSYRAALDDDRDFLYTLHRQVMQEYVEDTWGAWDEDWQREYFLQNFHPAHLQIIQFNGVDVGTLHIQDRAEELFIANLAILPAYQRQGIGTAVIQTLIETAASQGKPVALQVLKVNRGARSLYQRLGFGVTGETDTHYIMSFELRK
jgi:ribosomal protein S18 acetylase RimI-like enzyme